MYKIGKYQIVELKLSSYFAYIFKLCSIYYSFKDTNGEHNQYRTHVVFYAKNEHCAQFKYL